MMNEETIMNGLISEFMSTSIVIHRVFVRANNHAFILSVFGEVVAFKGFRETWDVKYLVSTN